MPTNYAYPNFIAKSRTIELVGKEISPIRALYAKISTVNRDKTIIACIACKSILPENRQRKGKNKCVVSLVLVIV
jgi:hypothetical protein